MNEFEFDCYLEGKTGNKQMLVHVILVKKDLSSAITEALAYMEVKYPDYSLLHIKHISQN